MATIRSRIPSDYQIARARSAILEHQDEIDRIELTINRLLDSIEQCRYEQRMHRAQIDLHKSTISLAARIPPEILAIVFEYCAHDGYPDTPITAMKVCSTWREATSFPSVWSVLRLSCERFQATLKARYWLLRLADAPLHLILHTRLASPEKLVEVMDTIVGRSPQLHQLSMITDAWEASYALSRIFPLAGNLQVVTLSLWEPDAASATTNGLEAFRVTLSAGPRLHEAHMHLCRPPAAGSLPSCLIMLQITFSTPVEERAFLTAESLIAMLRDTPLLESLIIDAGIDEIGQYTPHPDTTAEVALPKLRRIQLELPPDFFSLLAHIDAPSLETLRLRSMGAYLNHNSTLDSGDSLYSFLDRRRPPIKLLELYDFDLEQNVFIGCLPMLKELNELRLHDSDIVDSVLTSLEGSNGLCPLLSHLDLRWCGSLTGRAVVNIVKSRVVGSMAPSALAPISEVTVLNCAHVGEDDVLELASLTTCRLTTRPGDKEDFCRQTRCCATDRYRQRFMLKSLWKIPPEQRMHLKLVF